MLVGLHARTKSRKYQIKQMFTLDGFQFCFYINYHHLWVLYDTINHKYEGNVSITHEVVQLNRKIASRQVRSKRGIVTLQLIFKL